MNPNEISLIPVERKHLPFLEKIWKDPLTSKQTGIPSQGIDIESWYMGHLKAKKRGGCAQYIIRMGNEPVGEIAYGTLPDTFLFGSWEKDPSRKAAMADIKVDSGYWGRGIGKEAFSLLLDAIFSETEVMDVVTIPFGDNKRAIRLFKDCGMRPTGDENPRGVQVYMISREAR